MSEATTKAPPKVGEFCWNELLTNNTAKAEKFYHSLFGWTSEDISTSEYKYTMLKNGNEGIAGMMQIPNDQAQQIPPHWMSYVMVDDIEKMTAKAKGLGAKVKVNCQQVANYGRFSIIQDPTGATIALWQSLKTCE